MTSALHHMHHNGERDKVESPGPGPRLDRVEPALRRSAPAWLMLALVAFYKRCLSPVMPSACRFYPTCSEYAREAISRYGARRGGWMALLRLLRCRPFGPKGYDPVE